jgi:hypothetical protein
MPSDSSHLDLDGIRLPVANKTGGELVAFGRKHFQQICSAAKQGQIHTHDGKRVYVYDDAFDHACYEASTRGRRGISKDQISARRIECLRWIIPLISGCVVDSECWRVLELGRGHPPPRKRLYIYKWEPYVVWLTERRRRDGFRLRTAYPCGWADVERCTKNADGTLKIWER